MNRFDCIDKFYSYIFDHEKTTSYFPNSVKQHLCHFNMITWVYNMHYKGI